VRNTRKAASLPVRLDLDIKVRLLEAAKLMGVTPSTLVRILVASFVKEFERSGGKITLPPQWKTSEATK